MIMRAHSIISLVIVLVLGLVSQISKTVIIDTYRGMLLCFTPRRWPDNCMQHWRPMCSQHQQPENLLLHWPMLHQGEPKIELQTILRQDFTITEKTLLLSWLKGLCSASTFRTLLRHYAKEEPKHGIKMCNWDVDAKPKDHKGQDTGGIKNLC